MRAMNHPNYKPAYWTPERRKQASDAAKKRHADRRGRENLEWQRRQMGVMPKLVTLRRDKAQEMEHLAKRWNIVKAEVAQLDTAIKLVGELAPTLRKFGVTGEIA